MKGAILVFVAIHCVEFAENALGVVAHERSQWTESTAIPFAVCAAARHTHPTANQFKTKAFKVDYQLIRAYQTFIEMQKHEPFDIQGPSDAAFFRQDIRC